MEEGFRSRAGAVRELLADPATAYVLVTSARPDAVEEATFFAEKLAEREILPAALVVNRIHPHFGAAGGGSGVAGVAGVAGVTDVAAGPLQGLEANLATLNDAARREENSYAALAAKVAPAPVGRIPLFGQDVHDLGGLQRVAEVLFT
jgi:hypothetical protein